MPVPIKLVRVVKYNEEFLYVKSHDLPLHSLSRSHDNLNMLYLHYDNDCGNQIRQAGYIQ